MSERPFDFVSGGLRIEALINEVADPRFSALVLHPHPRFGGDMHNYVVGVLCEAFASIGATTMRFNFRGVGNSEGTFDNGAGESVDARAAAVALRTVVPDVPFVLAGYSFGAMIAASVAADVAPAGLVLASPPVAFAALQLADAFRAPVLLITGDRDPVAPAETIRGLASRRRAAVIVAGADHSWWPGVEALAEEVKTFVKSLEPASPSHGV